jgi:hypothetical protein
VAAYPVQGIQVWSEVLTQRIYCGCAHQAEDALQFETKELHWIGGPVNLLPG